MGMFDFIKNIFAKKMSRTTVTDLIREASADLPEVLKIMQDQVRKSTSGIKMVDGSPQYPELRHWRDVTKQVLESHGLAGWYDLYSAEKRLGAFWFIEAMSTRLVAEADRLLRDLATHFPEQAVPVQDMTVAQTAYLAIAQSLNAVSKHLLYGAMMVAAQIRVDMATDQDLVEMRSVLNTIYEDWRSVILSDRATALVMFTATRHGGPALADFIGKTPKTDMVDPSLTLAHVLAADPGSLARWVATPEGGMVKDFIPMLAIYVGDTIAEYRAIRIQKSRTDLEWLRASIQRLEMKRTAQSDPNEIARLTTVIENKERRSRELQNAIDKYNRGE